MDKSRKLTTREECALVIAAIWGLCSQPGDKFVVLTLEDIRKWLNGLSFTGKQIGQRVRELGFQTFRSRGGRYEFAVNTETMQALPESLPDGKDCGGCWEHELSPDMAEHRDAVLNAENASPTWEAKETERKEWAEGVQTDKAQIPTLRSIQVKGEGWTVGTVEDRNSAIPGKSAPDAQ